MPFISLSSSLLPRVLPTHIPPAQNVFFLIPGRLLQQEGDVMLSFLDKMDRSPSFFFPRRGRSLRLIGFSCFLPLPVSPTPFFLNFRIFETYTVRRQGRRS